MERVWTFPTLSVLFTKNVLNTFSNKENPNPMKWKNNNVCYPIWRADCLLCFSRPWLIKIFFLKFKLSCPKRNKISFELFWIFSKTLFAPSLELLISKSYAPTVDASFEIIPKGFCLWTVFWSQNVSHSFHQ